MTAKSEAEREGLATMGLRPLTAKEFRLFQELIQKSAGIFLSEVKKALLVGRLARRLRECGVDSFTAYHERVLEDPVELATMIDCICTNETHFFREQQHWRLLEERILPAWRREAEAGVRQARVRVWSAACSTGEEPYSLAMTLLENLPGWTVEILATDLSNKVLAAAREGLYRIEKSAEIPRRLLRRYMLKGTGSQLGKMKVGDEIANVVRFTRANLSHQPIAVVGRFDLVFCRNVLIYFTAEGRERVAREMLSRLEPEGYLFLGHAETLNGPGESVRTVIPTVYCQAPAPAAPGLHGAGRAVAK
ncbi:MAG TPA: protein-glutamate O-methyltransferase CheR [Myxococcales bacterium]|jgi:chemotaxis protein methyltransferase CheR